MTPTIKSLIHNAPTQMLDVVCRDGVLVTVIMQIAFPKMASKVGTILMKHNTVKWPVEFVFMSSSSGLHSCMFVFL